ncbi:MAG: DUF4424 family protein [Alphaproteobacteria bacterium]|nr:DUF4424 family protein [Alphaproteobacteria bacterium]
MLVRPLLAAAAAAALLAGAASANDGFAGITAAGLEFGKTDAVAMVSEDLRIGIDQIRVDYVFRNESAADVSGTVAFPMPPILVGTFIHAPTIMTPGDLDKANPLDFTATVDGKPVAVATDRRAYLLKYEEPADPEAPYVPPPPSAEYDAPGEDVTDILSGMGIPLSLDPETVMQALDKLTDEQVKILKDKGLAERDTYDNGPEMRWMIGWSVGIRHHWDQTFPAGAEVRISHTYDAFPNGGLFYWYDWTKPSEDWPSDPNADDKAKYCIDEGTGRAIKAALPSDPEAGGAHPGTAFNIQYVLTTAKTWKGPIGTFRLTLDKGKPENVLSVCMDGLTKSGPTSFTVEKTNYTPDKDLDILVVTADPAFKE